MPAQIMKVIFSLLILMTVISCGKKQNDIQLPVLDAIGGDFSLPSTLGKPINLSDYSGKTVLINFGFTFCPDICPTILTRLAKLSKEVEVKFGIDPEQLQIIFITVDPERDLVPHLTEYLAFFDPNFIGVRGSIEETEQVAKKYGVFFQKQMSEGDDYQVMHTDRIFLLDEKGQVRALFSRSDTDEKILSSIASIVN